MNDEDKRRWTMPANSANRSGRRVGVRKAIAHSARSESSRKWIERQLTDPYVQRTRHDGYRTRAAYKLLEIHAATQLLRTDARVIDLGCAPGGWLQVCLNHGIRALVGIDCLAVEPLAGAHIIHGDAGNQNDIKQALMALDGPPSLILSDMAANTTGHKATDSLRTAALAEMALDIACAHLAPGGGFCTKVFQGGATPDMIVVLNRFFRTVKHVKPPASRPASPEIYVVAKGFRGHRRTQ